MRGSLPGLPFRLARLARASPEASIAGSFLLQLMRILIEEKGSAAAGDAARKLVVTIGGAALQLNTVAFVATQDRSRLRVRSGHREVNLQCLLYPRKRTSALRGGMSAKGHERTLPNAGSRTF